MLIWDCPVVLLVAALTACSLAEDWYLVGNCTEPCDWDADGIWERDELGSGINGTPGMGDNLFISDANNDQANVVRFSDSENVLGGGFNNVSLSLSLSGTPREQRVIFNGRNRITGHLSIGVECVVETSTSGCMPTAARLEVHTSTACLLAALPCTTIVISTYL